jgi:16S rRNA (adenine(1408)-N(1))-methyltransferase
MAEPSRRAARAPARSGLPNALFVVAAVELLPPELRGVADELTIAFPWGSLLRGAVELDEGAAAGIASLLRPGGIATITLSIEARDGLDLPRLEADGACEALRDRWWCHGLQVLDLRPATPAELTSMRSTWARRLAAGRDRTAWRLDMRRPLPAMRVPDRQGSMDVRPCADIDPTDG